MSARRSSGVAQKAKIGGLRVKVRAACALLGINERCRMACRVHWKPWSAPAPHSPPPPPPPPAVTDRPTRLPPAQNIEAALQAEEQALTTVHIAVTKQLRRLEVGQGPGSWEGAACTCAAACTLPLLMQEPGGKHPLLPPPLFTSQAEEQLLQEILRRTEQEEGQAAPAGQPPQARSSQQPAQRAQRAQRAAQEDEEEEE